MSVYVGVAGKLWILGSEQRLAAFKRHCFPALDVVKGFLMCLQRYEELKIGCG